MLWNCLNSTQTVNIRSFSSNKHQETKITLHGLYDGHLKDVFVLQNNPLNLQNEDSFQNATKLFKFNADGKQSFFFFK